MGYTLLGKLVWRLGRRYLRRRYPNAGRKLKLAVAGTAVVGVTAAVLRRRSPVPE